jgi:hypothetical protein
VSTNVALFDKQISAGFESSLISAITGETSYSKTFLAIVRTEDAAVNYAP